MVLAARLVFGVVLFSATLTLAGPGLVERCKEDPLDHIEQVFGRNAWAKKCGYISNIVETAFNAEGMYAVFTSGKFNGNPNIPVDANHPCIQGLVKLGTCVRAGCYTPNQFVMFGGSLVGIESAFLSGHDSVTALDVASESTHLLFSEQSIESYVSGETEELIYKITMENEKILEITGNHPLVDKDGLIVKGESVRAGDSLLSEAGSGVRIKSIEVIPYEGKVWNVQPTSVERVENIIIADGILTGSIRFQNEWAEEGYRLSLRDQMDVSILSE